MMNWLLQNWDTYVGVSFLYRNDPTKTAADLGFLYLPQEVVSKEDYEAYMGTLKPLMEAEFHLTKAKAAIEVDEVDMEPDCATGACPIR